jgi:positive regulator of sigma E activity
LRCSPVVRFISNYVVRHVPEISFRRFFQQGDGSSTEEVSFSRYVPSLIIFTAILSAIFLLFGVDPSAVFVAVGVSALGFSAAVYLLSKRFGKMPERGLNAAVSAYFTNVGLQPFIAKALFTGEPWVATAAVAFMAFLAFYMPYDLAKFWIREETRRSVSRS